MNRRELKQNYILTPRAVGVYQIRNLANEKVCVGQTMNLEGILNRRRFQLKMGSDPNKTLQKEWNKLGEENFAFEILEVIEPREGLDYDRELEFLEDLWLEKLEPYDDKGYNERKKTREERLRMIASNRKVL